MRKTPNSTVIKRALYLAYLWEESLMDSMAECKRNMEDFKRLPATTYKETK
jgi:hypothetical protein